MPMIINTLNTDVQEETWENEEKQKGCFAKAELQINKEFI